MPKRLVCAIRQKRPNRLIGSKNTKRIIYAKNTLGHKCSIMHNSPNRTKRYIKHKSIKVKA